MAHTRDDKQGMVFGSYLNYALFGPDFKSDWAERGWSCKLFGQRKNSPPSFSSDLIALCSTLRHDFNADQHLFEQST